MTMGNSILLGESLFQERDRNKLRTLKEQMAQEGGYVTTLLERRGTEPAGKAHFLNMMLQLLQADMDESLYLLHEDLRKRFGSTALQELQLNFQGSEIRSIEVNYKEESQSQCLGQKELELLRRLSGTLREDKLRAVLDQGLRELGVSCCSIYLIGGTRFGGSMNNILPPEEAKCVYSLESGDYPDQWISMGMEGIPLLRWIPRNCHRFILPLAFEDEIMGFIFMEDLDSLPYSFYEDLRLRLSFFFKALQITDELKALSLYDEMTQIYNLRGFEAVGEQLIRQGRRLQVPICLFYCDIDGLAKINQHRGRDKGDQVLKESAQMLQSTFRKNDVLGRVGSDEFAILTLGVSEEHEELITNRLKAGLTRLHQSHDMEHFDMSIQISRLRPEDPYSLKDLLSMAEYLMHEEKK